MKREEIKKLFSALVPEAAKQAEMILKSGTNREKIQLINSLLDRLDLPKTKNMQLGRPKLDLTNLTALKARREEIILERKGLTDGEKATELNGKAVELNGKAVEARFE